MCDVCGKQNSGNYWSDPNSGASLNICYQCNEISRNQSGAFSLIARVASNLKDSFEERVRQEVERKVEEQVALKVPEKMSELIRQEVIAAVEQKFKETASEEIRQEVLEKVEDAVTIKFRAVEPQWIDRAQSRNKEFIREEVQKVLFVDGMESRTSGDLS